MSFLVRPAATHGRLIRPFAGKAQTGNGNDTFTKLLLHCDGLDTSTTFEDASVGGVHGAATVAGNAQVDTAESKFGGASLLSDGTGDWLTYASHVDWNLGGTGGGNDFTIDFWIRPAGASGGLYPMLTATNGPGAGWSIYRTTGDALAVWHGAGTEQTVAAAFTLGTWTHIAIARQGTTTRAFQDGALLGTFTDADWNNDGNELGIALESSGSDLSLNGHMDEIRISKGIARWTSAFTPWTSAYGA